MKIKIRFTLLLVAILCSYHNSYPQKLSSPVKYYVISDRGRDNNNGTSETSAFKIIQKAADVAQPGDTILVYSGIYRERVKPPRGGTGENARITYMAKPGNHVTITALDPWTPKWSADSNLYYAIPPNEMFSDSNYVCLLYTSDAADEEDS